MVQVPAEVRLGRDAGRVQPRDGQLYVGGLKGGRPTGKDGCLQRVRYTGKPVHLPGDLHVTRDGIADHLHARWTRGGQRRTTSASSICLQLVERLRLAGVQGVAPRRSRGTTLK